MKTLLLIRLLVIVLSKCVFTSKLTHRYLDMYDRWSAVINQQASSRGNLEMFRMVKAIRTHFLAALSGHHIQHSTYPSVGVNKEGIPRLASFLHPLLTGNEWDKRFLTTQQYLTRVLPGHGEPSFVSLEATWSGVFSTQLQLDLIRVQGILSQKVPSITWVRPHLTVKAGPNGPALDQAMNDQLLLPTWQVKDLITLGGQAFQTYLRRCQAQVRYHLGPQTLTEPKGANLRKLSFVYDPEGKVRVIAILDYWSQSVQKPLHMALQAMLREFPADCTFNQVGRLSSVIPRPMFYCFDLTAATDRFPIAVQSFILEQLFGTSVAEAWRRIMVHLPFATKGRPAVYYAVGQPMGAYSSWPLFALCHHLVVQVAAQRAGFTLIYTNYMLLGDDIVIGDESVANYYRDIQGELGVQISSDKSLVSSDTQEFAKRLIHQGKDVSPAPLRSWLEGRNTLSSILSFLYDLEARWNTCTLTSRPVIRQLLSPQYPSKHGLHLATMRVWESWMIPAARDSMEQRESKALQCFRHLCFSYLGCSVSQERIWLVLNQFIPMLRMGAIHGAMVRNFKELKKAREGYLLLFKGTYHSDCGTDNLPALLMELIPTQVAGADQAQDTQAEIDRMNSAIEQGLEETYFDQTPVIPFNPTVTSSGPRSCQVYPISSRIPKGIKGLVRMYLTQREAALASCDG